MFGQVTPKNSMKWESTEHEYSMQKKSKEESKGREMLMRI
jgi:hypothetical protein